MAGSLACPGQSLARSTQTTRCESYWEVARQKGPLFAILVAPLCETAKTALAPHPRSALFTSMPVDSRSAAPLYRQLYERVRNSILQGRLAPGTRLPSSRALSNELNLSRNTVILAYEQLLAEGYVEGKTGAGTFVSRHLPEDFFEIADSHSAAPGMARTQAVLSRRGTDFTSGPETLAQRARAPRAVERVLPAIDGFPVKTWARIVARRWRNQSADLMGYGDPAGYRPLREAVAAYLGATRGLECSADQVVIVSAGVDLLVRLLLDPGDAVWVEDPCYPAFRRTLLGAGARLIPVPVDAEGLDVAAGISRCAAARLAYVTPSYQYPLGMTMSLRRRMALLEWASRTGAWIIEDDYGSEHRYHGRPLASLQGLDRNGRVIYFGSFSRVLFPALSLTYVVVPPSHVGPCIAARAAIEGTQRSFDQSVVADFMTQGHFVRHLRRMRKLYAERQQALLRAVARELGGLLKVQPADGGMFLVGWLPRGVDDRAASRLAHEHGVLADPLSPLYARRPRRGGLLLGYSSVGPARLREGVRKLAEALRTLIPAAR